MAYGRMQGMRRNLSGGARRMLGHTSSGIRFLGRTNNHFKGLGISNPAIDKGISMAEKYALPTIDFLQNELGSDQQNAYP
jgi:hypothetical protein